MELLITILFLSCLLNAYCVMRFFSNNREYLTELSQKKLYIEELEDVIWQLEQEIRILELGQSDYWEQN